MSDKMRSLILEGSLDDREFPYKLTPVRSLSIRKSRTEKCNGLANFLSRPLLVYHNNGGLSALRQRSGLFLGWMSFTESETKLPCPQSL